MLSQQIADKICAKVSALVSQELRVTDEDGQPLAQTSALKPESIALDSMPWAIPFSYSGSVVGNIVLMAEMPNHEEIAPLIRSIAELVMHQSLVLEQIPRQDERLDKFIYDLLNQPQPDWALLTAEARLFDIELDRPRIAIVIQIDDPSLTARYQDPSGDREVQLQRYKAGITRALNSFYTSSRENVVSYLGGTSFCILKDLLPSGDSDLEAGLESFKKSLSVIYGILKSELKPPATVGIGNYHPGLEGLRQSYHEATSAIELGAQTWDADRVYHIDDFGVVAPLLSGVDENNIYFSRELLERLGENHEIIQTLEAFFNLDMSLTRTAEELGIHRNTLVYRLDRITEALGLNPRVFDDAIQIKLAILYSRFVERT
ncbi:MAG TPA: helix-turn-helix domain-containing protein [Candidatus Saccharimonadia bacterium]|jgi:carbohydrate diacid regulator|nr:helix-turn-helix domain-containing protein [Candidatus Saccharimonadia bacterium]